MLQDCLLYISGAGGKGHADQGAQHGIQDRVQITLPDAGILQMCIRDRLKERLARQLRQRGTEAELLEFDSGEAFLAAEEAQRFTAAFLDIYMDGLSGMDAAKELRKTDADCLLVFTTTSTDHALEGRCV